MSEVGAGRERVKLTPAAPRGDLRWLVPAGLLALEMGALTLIADFPRAGPAAGLVPAVRVALPVLFAAAASAWILARSGGSAALPALSLPPWRPGPSLLLHGVAFLATAALARLLLGEGTASVEAGAFVVWLACAALTGILALRSAAPLSWMWRALLLRWKSPALALAAGLLSWRTMAAAEDAWGGLALGTLRAVAWVLNGLRSGVMVDLGERAIGLGDFEIEVAASCSGVDSVGLVLLFQGLWIAISRDRLRMGRTLVLLPFGVAAALAGNVARISALVLLGASGWPDLAVGAFHSKVGWLLFAAIALGTIALAERLPWFQRECDRPEAQVATGDAAAYLAPLLAAMACAFLAEFVRTGPVDLLYGLRIAAAVGAYLAMGRALPALRQTWSSEAAAMGAAVGLAWVLGVSGDGRALADGLAALPPWARWSWIAVRALGSTLVIPVVEELAFRGWLLPRLVAPGTALGPGRPWSLPAAVLSSLAFGALHPNWLAGTLSGVVFALAQQRRGRLGDAVLAHATSNAIISAAVLARGRWDLWA